MAGDIGEDPGAPAPATSALGRALEVVVIGLNAVGSAWVLMITVLVCADVALRYLFNRPIAGVPLVITMSLVSIVFLQGADALRNGRMTRNEALLGRLISERPRLGLALQALFHLAGAVFCLLLVIYSGPLYLKAWRSQAYLGTQGDVTLPEWPFKLLIIIGALTLMLQFLVMAWHDLRRRSQR